MTCIFENTFLDSDRFLSLSLHSLTAFQVPIHIFGAYLILFKTPKSMASVKNSILQLHCATSFMDFFMCFLLIFYVWIPSPSGYPAGFMSFIGINSSIQIFLALNSLVAVGISTVAFFENRYDALVIGNSGRPKYRNIKRIVYFTANSLGCSAVIAYIIFEMPDVEAARASLKITQKCIPHSLIDNPLYINLNVDSETIPLLTIAMVTIIFLQGFYFVFYTLYYLFFSVLRVSKHTQRMQKKFFIAMLLQAFIPLAAFAGPIYYYFFAYRYNYLNQKYNNFAMIAVGFNGLMTTVVMVLVQQPYRQAVSDMLGIWKETSGRRLSLFIVST